MINAKRYPWEPDYSWLPTSDDDPLYNVPGSGNYSTLEDAPEEKEEADKPKNGQIVLNSLPELLESLLGGTAAVVNATQGTTPAPINNYTTVANPETKKDNTPGIILGFIGLFMVSAIGYFLYKSTTKKKSE